MPRISRYKRREKLFFMKIINFPKSKAKLKKAILEGQCPKTKPRQRLLKGKNLVFQGSSRATCRNFHDSLLDQFNSIFLDSDSGKIYVIFKCFHNANTTAKSVSSNSSSKNSDPTKYASFGKPKILKISDLNSNAS